MVVRAFRPDAERVALLIDGEKSGRAMARVHPAGVFEIRLQERRELFAYQLEILFRGGTSITTRDPYCFLPTLGDLDLYLLGELKHERPTRCSARIRASWAASPAWHLRSGRPTRAA